ncbi:MAG TPA: hypothetical protein P5545_00235 [Bacteroidota bacterium]|mgnify:CR=1 FL=1|nr:hypothetical protein [Candidatus Kapabacteria bacterium]HRS00961.1 hypothetical protein [Bacteroidota bacterium]
MENEVEYNPNQLKKDIDDLIRQGVERLANFITDNDSNSNEFFKAMQTLITIRKTLDGTKTDKKGIVDDLDAPTNTWNIIPKYLKIAK